MKRKTNAVGRGKEHGRGLSEAMKCLGFRLLKFPGAGTAYRNKEMEDAVFDVVQTADEARAPTKMTGQPVTMSVYKLPDFTDPEDIREFRDLGEMFCWWYDMISSRAGLRKSRKKNPVGPASLTISREEARVLSPMPLAEVKKVGPVLISPEGVKLFWSDKDGWSLYGYRSDRGDIMQAAKRAKKIAGPEQHRMNPDDPRKPDWMPAVVQDYGDLIAAYQRAREKLDGERMRQIRSKAEAVLGVMNAATERLALKTFGSIE